MYPMRSSTILAVLATWLLVSSCSALLIGEEVTVELSFGINKQGRTTLATVERSILRQLWREWEHAISPTRSRREWRTSCCQADEEGCPVIVVGDANGV